jgi:hypothetical protein
LRGVETRKLSRVSAAFAHRVQVAHDLQGDFEVVADGLQEISDSLPSHQAYHTIVIAEAQNPLRPPLIRIYVEALTYSILSVRYLQGGVLSMLPRLEAAQYGLTSL